MEGSVVFLGEISGGGVSTDNQCVLQKILLSCERSGQNGKTRQQHLGEFLFPFFPSLDFLLAPKRLRSDLVHRKKAACIPDEAAPQNTKLTPQLGLLDTDNREVVDVGTTSAQTTALLVERAGSAELHTSPPRKVGTSQGTQGSLIERAVNTHCTASHGDAPGDESPFFSLFRCVMVRTGLPRLVGRMPTVLPTHLLQNPAVHPA